MSTNKPHEFSLGFFSLKGEDIEKIENAIFEMFNKMRSDNIINNDPKERYDKDEVPKPNRVISFHLYETKDEV